MDDMRNEIALVTGAARGIGKKVVEELHNENIRVIGIDNDASRLEKLNKSYEGNMHTFVADVSDEMRVNEVIDYVEKNIGPIEYLVNVAGVLSPAEIKDISVDDWRRIFEVNSTGVFITSQAVSRYMMSRNSGSIVTIGSNAAYVPRFKMAAYASSKAAVTMFTKCLGLELAKYNIRCNVISPGSTDTDMQRAIWRGKDGYKEAIDGSKNDFKVGIPLRKIAKTQDICNLVTFLLSNKSNHMTMCDITVDGGATLGAK